MLPNCTATITELFSPVSRLHSEHAATSTSGSRGQASFLTGNGSQARRSQPIPRVNIDEGFFFRDALYRLHCSLVERTISIPVGLRLVVEVTLLAAASAQLTALVTLHSVLMPSPTHPQVSGTLAKSLEATLQSPSKAVELLRIDISAPPSWPCSTTIPESAAPGTWGELRRQMCLRSTARVQCEFAAEVALLQLAPPLREGAYKAKNSSAVAVAVNISDAEGGRIAPVVPVDLLVLPGLASAVLSRHILAAVVSGPLRDELRARYARERLAATTTTMYTQNHATGTRNYSGNSDTPAAARLALGLSGNMSNMNASGANSSRAARNPGCPSLAFVSCNGQPPVSMQPLRRAAELLNRRAEWWLFKAVWAVSTAVFLLLAGVTISFGVRSALAAVFQLRRAVQMRRWSEVGGSLEMLETLVLAISPAALAMAVWRLAGMKNDGLLVIFSCLSIGEVAFVFLLRTKESRYIFPRALLPVLVVDTYYTLFHPFGFTTLSHGALCCFEAFLICTLWSHFEVTLPLPKVSPDHLAVSVKLRPSSHAARNALPFSPQMQRLLVEQGLLLLGDDTSYESGVVMSALVARALQASRPPPAVLMPTRGQRMASAAQTHFSVERLGGGPAAQTLVENAQTGDERCKALLDHLFARLPPSPPPLVLRNCYQEQRLFENGRTMWTPIVLTSPMHDAASGVAAPLLRQRPTVSAN